MVVEADLPGLTKNDVERTVGGGLQVAEGGRKFETEDKNQEFFRCERSLGRFLSSSGSAGRRESGRHHGHRADGVFKVRIPLPEEKPSKARKITVS